MTRVITISRSAVADCAGASRPVAAIGHSSCLACLRSCTYDASSEPVLQAEIHFAMAWICNLDLSEGIRHADAAAALLQDADDQPSLLAGVLGAAMREQDDSSRFEVVLELGHLECLAGRWWLAEQYANETAEIMDLTGQTDLRPAVLVLDALVNALLGRLDVARVKAADGLAGAEAAHSLWFTLMALPVLGFLELSAGQPDEAVRQLAQADDICERIGLHEPGRFRFLADFVEALIMVGDLDRAGTVLERFEQRGRRLGRKWALATAARCRMLLLSAQGQADAALAQLYLALAYRGSADAVRARQDAARRRLCAPAGAAQA
jgi:tetratricopeptide (TPR) repeat protein